MSAALPLSAVAIEPITKEGVTLRVVEAGEFRQSQLQGMELELVNASDAAVTCDVRMTLHRDGTEVQRTEKQQDQLPGHARRGFRVVEPLTYGHCRVEYEVGVNGAAFASDRIEFQASGPYRLSARLWFLSRDAVQVTLELLKPAAAKERYRFTLRDKDRRKVLFQTEQYKRMADKSPSANPARPKTWIEAFVSLAKRRTGDYVIEAEVLEDRGGQPVATARLSLLLVAD